MSQYATFVLRWFTFVDGFGVCLPKQHPVLGEPLSNLCTEGRAENSILPFHRDKRVEVLTFNTLRRTCL